MVSQKYIFKVKVWSLQGLMTFDFETKGIVGFSYKMSKILYEKNIFPKNLTLGVVFGTLENMKFPWVYYLHFQNQGYIWF